MYLHSTDILCFVFCSLIKFWLVGCNRTPDATTTNSRTIASFDARAQINNILPVGNKVNFYSMCIYCAYFIYFYINVSIVLKSNFSKN